MKFIFSILLVSFFIVDSFSQDFVTQLEIARTFNIKRDSLSGTSFLIQEKNKNYFVTAKHVLGSVTNGQKINFQILHDSVWDNVKGIVLIHSNPKIDIALIVTGDSNQVGINLNTVEVALGDEGFFIGFPFGLKTADKGNINSGFPFPLIKKCVFSGVYQENGFFIFFLDGNNNPGFSGAPVLFKNRFDPADKKLYLFGIVSSYITQKNQMVTPIGLLDYNENSGIILAYSSTYIREIITQNLK